MVHLYKLNGYNIVLDVFSGSVHNVDEAAYDAIGMYETHTQEEIRTVLLQNYADELTDSDINELFEDIEELKASGKLFTEDVYADKAFDLKKRNTVIKALCLHVAHTCNLNCEYCFASQGKYQGDRALMSLEVGKRALDSHDKHFRFTITTNGVLLNDEIMEFCNREMDNVVMSLDGRREIHDRLRKTVNGKGSYDTIVPKFKKLVEKREGRGYYIRGTFTHNNTDFTNDIFHMADLGFTELSMEPVVCKPDDPYALTKDDLPVLFEQYEILAKEMLKREKESRPFTFYHYMIDLEHGPCIYKRISGCGSGTEYMAVTPWGELFPCHQFVGDEKYSLGNIWDGVQNKEVQNEFKLCNAYARKECQDCWAKLYCSGGCAANSYHSSGSVTGVYEYGCELFKKRMECAIMMKVALSTES